MGTYLEVRDTGEKSPTSPHRLGDKQSSSSQEGERLGMGLWPISWLVG